MAKNIHYSIIVLCVYFALLVPISVYADFIGNTSVQRIRVHGTSTYVGFNPQPGNSCSSWGEHIKFDHRTETGKAYLSTLLSAKMSGKPVHLWYSASATPGADQNSGCIDTTMSVLSGVGIP